MKHYMRFLLATVVSIASISAYAGFDPIPITADEAFDAVQTGTDPIDPEIAAVVALVDVRTRAEYFWVGTAAQVDAVVLKGEEDKTVWPDLGKVRLIEEGKFLEYTIDGRYKRTQVEKVAKLETTAIALSIPYQLWDEAAAARVPNPAFTSSIDALAEQGVEVLIVFCKSGGRSTSCIVNLDAEVAEKFDAIYEIDEPTGPVTGVHGVGGFEGNAYNQVYNGYVGFPGRLTEIQENPSVSWKDAGLPIKVGVQPPPLPTD
jgi:rhodanese-related sulfurtransferase